MTVSWKQTVTALALGFFLGVAAARTTFAFRYGSAEARERTQIRITEKLISRLRLSPEQEKQTREIIDRRRREARAIWQGVRPTLDEVREKGRQEVRALLTPDQQKGFDAIRREVDASRS